MILLTAVIAALLCLGGLAAAWPSQARRLAWSAAAAAVLGAAAASLSVTLADLPAAITLPIGLPGAAFRLSLDPPAAFFLALTYAAGAAMIAFAAASEAAAATATGGARATVSIPICLGFFGLAILGADGLTRGAALIAAATALWASGPADRSAAVLLCVTLLAGAAVIAAAAAPPQARLWAALIGPGALAGLVPPQRWIGPAHREAAQAGTLLAGVAVPVAIYLMLRLLFGTGSIVPPAWWGLPLSLLGAVSAVAGGVDAARAADLDTALAAGTVRQTGLVALGLGIALSARAADLPAVETMALAAVLLLAGMQAIAGTLQALANGAIRDGAGTRQLDRLGGLVHRMPGTTVCLLAALIGLAALPPGVGFAAAWLLVHALIGLPHAATLPSQLLRCALIATLGLASALAAAGLLRLTGMACLGRPRTPRAAVAREPPRPARLVLAALAVAATAAGVLAGPLLILFGDAPMRTLSGTGVRPLASWLGIAAGAESPGYAPLPVTGLLLLTAALVLWLRRLTVPSSIVSGPAWEDGFAAPPAWLPFGDPVTQTAGSGFVPEFARCLDPDSMGVVQAADRRGVAPQGAYGVPVSDARGVPAPDLCTSPAPDADGTRARDGSGTPAHDPSGVGSAGTRLPWPGPGRGRPAAVFLAAGSAVGFSRGGGVRPGSAPALVLILLAALLILCSWIGAA